jgi:hypothetical protein
MAIDSLRADIWAKYGHAYLKLGKADKARLFLGRAAGTGVRLVDVSPDSVRNWLGQLK